MGLPIGQLTTRQLVYQSGPENKRGCPRQKPQSFCKLLSEVIDSPSFCCIPFIRSETKVQPTCKERGLIIQDMKTSGDHWGHCTVCLLYVCVCACVHVYEYIHTCTHTHVFICVCTHIYTHMYKRIHTHTFIYRENLCLKCLIVTSYV